MTGAMRLGLIAAVVSATLLERRRQARGVPWKEVADPVLQLAACTVTFRLPLSLRYEQAARTRSAEAAHRVHNPAVARS